MDGTRLAERCDYKRSGSGFELQKEGHGGTISYKARVLREAGEEGRGLTGRTLPHCCYPSEASSSSDPGEGGGGTREREEVRGRCLRFDRPPGG